MVPDQSVIASEQGLGTHRVVAARAEDGGFAIVYVPEGQAVTIRMDKLRGPSVDARWYDPRDGSWKAIGRYPGKGRPEFVAPSKGEQADWVLVLDAIR
jgi:hypothetical protein